MMGQQGVDFGGTTGWLFLQLWRISLSFCRFFVFSHDVNVTAVDRLRYYVSDWCLSCGVVYSASIDRSYSRAAIMFFALLKMVSYIIICRTMNRPIHHTNPICRTGIV
jgi:hypothetical protein